MDAVPVEVGAVGAAQGLHHHGLAPGVEVGVPAGRLAVGDQHAVAFATDLEGVAQLDEQRAAARLLDLEDRMAHGSVPISRSSWCRARGRWRPGAGAASWTATARPGAERRTLEDR